MDWSSGFLTCLVFKFLFGFLGLEFFGWFVGFYLLKIIPTDFQSACCCPRDEISQRICEIFFPSVGFQSLRKGEVYSGGDFPLHLPCYQQEGNSSSQQAQPPLANTLCYDVYTSSNPSLGQQRGEDSYTLKVTLILWHDSPLQNCVLQHQPGSLGGLVQALGYLHWGRKWSLKQRRQWSGPGCTAYTMFEGDNYVWFQMVVDGPSGHGCAHLLAKSVCLQSVRV